MLDVEVQERRGAGSWRCCPRHQASMGVDLVHLAHVLGNTMITVGLLHIVFTATGVAEFAKPRLQQ